MDYFSDFIRTDHNLKVESFWHPSLAQWNWGAVANLDELYTIKVSHSFWTLKNNSWTKHMFHITEMKKEGAKLIPELFDILYPIWEERYGKKRANLEASPDEFFSPTIDRKYDHDSVHASVAYYDEPLFNRILRDDSEVAVSQAKFLALSEEDKIRLVNEEAYATALERRIIPSDYKFPARPAYSWAIQMTITSFSKGWFPLYIVDNFINFIKPDVDYVQRHLDNKDKLVLL